MEYDNFAEGEDQIAGIADHPPYAFDGSGRDGAGDIRRVHHCGFDHGIYSGERGGDFRIVWEI